MASPQPTYRSGEGSESKTIPAVLQKFPYLSTLSNGVSESSVVLLLPEIPKFQILRYINSGGMGIVFEALDQLGHKVALKVIRSDRLDSQFIARFRKEALAMKELRHPNIVRIFEYGETDSSPCYFTMEYLGGGTLAQEVDYYRNNQREAIELISKVARAVGYLHSREKVHRDLKPSNILLDENKEPYLSDFGLVKDQNILPDPGRTFANLGTTVSVDITNEETRIRGGSGTGSVARLELTNDYAQVGTRPYMSPEQIEGQKDQVGPASDIWAIGVILYELVVGQRPFESPVVTVLEQMIRKVELDFEFPDKLIDPALIAVLRKCLAKKPEERYAKAEDIAEDLQRYLHAKPDTVVDYIPLPPPTPQPVRSWIPTLILLVGFLSLIGYGIWGGTSLSAVKTSSIPAQGGIAPNGLQALQDQVRDQKQLPLLDETGKPAWFQWLVQEGTILDANEHNGLFTLQNPAPSKGLLELMRGLPSEAVYRFSAQIKPTSADGTFGMYVGRSSFTSESEAAVHCFTLIEICEKNHAVNVYTRSCQEEETGKVATPPALRVSKQPIPADGWWHVMIEISPSQIRYVVNQVELAIITKEQLSKRIKDLKSIRPNHKFIDPQFLPSDGMGLFARGRSAISIRHLLLERLN